MMLFGVNVLINLQSNVDAALALVQVNEINNENGQSPTSGISGATTASPDLDLQRARDLVDLHHTVKEECGSHVVSRNTS